VRPAAIALVILAAVLCAPPALAAAKAPRPGEVQHLHFRYGPIHVAPGSNLIVVSSSAEKPSENGYITRIKPNLKLKSGAVPPTWQLHLHHGVWLNMSRHDATSPLPFERFFASGEEKTILSLPRPYGYFSRGSDQWALNYMIHDLVTRPFTVYITYDVDFVPSHSRLGRRMRPVKPIWMDVENGKTYPVFDVPRGAGANGAFTYPTHAQNPYRGAPRNEWTVNRGGTLVATAGHLHPGGLRDDLEVVRPGARVTRSRGGPISGDVPGSVRIFRSNAHYFDPHGPVSWDVAMTATRPNWRVRLRPGDVLRTTTTYESARASWYEGMGIMVAYMAYDSSGVDPFAHAVPTTGKITHGHLRENDRYGGTAPKLANALTLPGTAAPNNTVKIQSFRYVPGDLSAAGAAKDPPTISQGQSLTFVNTDGTPTIPFDRQVSHSITACKAPCNLSTGISYPIADGDGGFDSGQLGFGTPFFTAFANRNTWQTPTNLRPGTYTFFCRIHPFMRGAFRVTG
jgi:plastocyanin